MENNIGIHLYFNQDFYNNKNYIKVKFFFKNGKKVTISSVFERTRTSLHTPYPYIPLNDEQGNSILETILFNIDKEELERVLKIRNEEEIK